MSELSGPSAPLPEIPNVYYGSKMPSEEENNTPSGDVVKQPEPTLNTAQDPENEASHRTDSYPVTQIDVRPVNTSLRGLLTVAGHRHRQGQRRQFYASLQDKVTGVLDPNHTPVAAAVPPARNWKQRRAEKKVTTHINEAKALLSSVESMERAREASTQTPKYVPVTKAWLKGEKAQLEDLLKEGAIDYEEYTRRLHHLPHHASHTFHTETRFRQPDEVVVYPRSKASIRQERKARKHIKKATRYTK